MNLQQRSALGLDFLSVVLPAALPRNQEFTLKFHYRGNVIEDAGNGVLFVGARESWYPHLGDGAEFAAYDVTLRWPRKLRLIATGSNSKSTRTATSAWDIGRRKGPLPSRDSISANTLRLP